MISLGLTIALFLEPETVVSRGSFCASRFVLNRLIGSGAFGEVYDVYDREKGAHVAIKVAKVTHRVAIAHEVTIVQKLATLRVRNVTELQGVGNCPLLQDRPFYAMRIEDGTIESFMEHGNVLDGPAVFSLLFELFFTVRQFREIGFQHRDIKPDNILYRNVGMPREYALKSGKTFHATGPVQPIFADFNTGTFEPDPRSNDVVSLVHAILADLIRHNVIMNEQEQDSLQAVVDVAVQDDGTAGAVERILESILAASSRRPLPNTQSSGN